MLKVIPPFEFVSENQAVEFLLENYFSPHFSLKQKVYYKFLRKLIPINVRQQIQEKTYSSIKYKESFIDSELVDVLKTHPEFEKSVKHFYPDGARSALVLTHDVEEEEGFNYIPKILDLEEGLGLRSSWNIVPYKYKIDEGIIREIQSRGFEIGIHGYNHDGKLYFSEKIFNERVPYINSAIKKYGAVGFRSPMVHRNLTWLQRLDVEYDASCFDYDAFQPFSGGTKSIWPFIAGKFVELPYTIPQDHTLFYSLKQINPNLWIEKTKWVYDNFGTILVLTHPDYLINKEHLSVYTEYLQYLKGLDSVWHGLPRELAARWKMLFSPKNDLSNPKSL